MDVNTVNKKQDGASVCRWLVVSGLSDDWMAQFVRFSFWKT